MATATIPPPQAGASYAARKPIWREVLAGWRDGRRGLPRIGATGRGGALVPTGHMQAIISEAREALDRTYLDLLARTAEQRVEFAALGPRAEGLGHAIQERAARLSVLIADGPREGRRMGEDHLSEDQVQRRRVREHERRINAARRQLADLRDEAAEVHARRVEIETAVRGTLQQALANGERLSARAELRVANYLKGACRSHPNPDALIRSANAMPSFRRAWQDSASVQDLMSRPEGGTGAQPR